MINHTKQDVINYIKDNYNESDIIDNVDEIKSDFLDEDWEDNFEDEEEAYQETGRGEAEAQVRIEIENDIFKHFGYGTKEECTVNGHDTRYDMYREMVGEEIWDTIYRVYPDLNKS